MTTSSEVYPPLFDVFHTVLAGDLPEPFTRDLDLYRDLDFDSLTLFDLVAQLDLRHAIRADDPTPSSWMTVGDVEDFCRTYRANGDAQLKLVE